ncbi:hypothetical protein KSP39_PZI019372 [Platanthera zijinensis]|uniref:Copia protein n=1 Tax=Platanthera zijinensis TaxID=2320716 RepID=A0AAP0B2A4_9ASPA
MTFHLLHRLSSLALLWIFSSIKVVGESREGMNSSNNNWRDKVKGGNKYHPSSSTPIKKSGSILFWFKATGFGFFFDSTLETVDHCSPFRPDITFVVGLLGRYQSNPKPDHWVVVKKVLRYLKGTSDIKLVYHKVQNLKLVGYTDSDFIGCGDDRKSTLGYIFRFADGAILWKSVKQTLITSSTMHAEFVALFRVSTHAVLLKNFISELKVVDFIAGHIRLYCDNIFLVMFSINNKSITRSKHVEIKFLTFKELVKNGDILVEHLEIDDMLADPLTKELRPNVFQKYVINMGLKELFDVLD